ncbi:YceI family protein [Leptospira ilyithenensis]|uniref:YceI family protein n=1 Tax=Leptospira ilyithenensis TaxID=2484901 RepID=A0A4R9LIM1_9LEPT|nr:YceI family protein [Leptospira ilyithenensis]TGN06442.1 YceI family protein [Leptospira ilyithenensis]
MKKYLFFLTIVSFSFLTLAPSLFASEVLKKEIGFYVDHATANVIGVCNEVELEPIRIKASKTGYSLGSPFQIKIPISKITSGDEGRDAHIKEILGSPEYSLIQVKIESVTQEGEVYTVSGKLTIHGITKDFKSNLTVDKVEKDQIEVKGKTIARFSEYQLENPSLLFLKAKDEIEIRYLFLIRSK